jgi:excisionase family DNA binding protein
MGTYRLHASANEVLEHIRAFAREEGLGEVVVRHREKQVEADTPTSSDQDDICCSWICKDEAGQCVVEMKVRASRRQTAALYLGLSVAAFGLAAIGILLLVGGLDAVPCILLPLIVGAVGLFLVYRLRWNDIVLSALDFEHPRRPRGCGMAENADTPRQGARKVNGPRELLTVEEVADFLRVRPSTVYEWAKDGRIPASKVGRLWRFSREEIEAWVRNGGTQPNGPEQRPPG